MTLFDQNGPPRWVSILSNEPLPLPSTTLGYLGYGADLFCTVRGPSWASERRFDFSTPVFLAVQAPFLRISRRQYLQVTICRLIALNLLMDAMDSIIKSIHFDPLSMYPVSEALPFHLQIFCSILSGLWIFTQMATNMDLAGFICVALGLTAPWTWPSMFDGIPFFAASLPEFWGRRWHYMFRRPFERLTVPFFGEVEKDPVALAEKGLGTRVVMRSGMIFFTSGILHIAILYRIPPSKYHPLPSQLWDPSVFFFFFSQIFGFGLDGLLRIGLRGSSSGTVRMARRLFMWGWLCWTARWWADGWVRKGMWDQHQDYVPYSPIRGLLYGRWTSLKTPLT